MQGNFCQFQIPVTVLIPGEVINTLCGNIKPVIINGIGGCFNNLLKTGGNPAVCQGKMACITRKTVVLVFCIHQHITGCVPEFIAKVTITFDSAAVQTYIAAGRCQ